MIAAIDVHYKDDMSATAAAVVFSGFYDSKEYRTYIREISGVADYEPGQFYRRELPCIIAIIQLIEEKIDAVIIDGYVDLGVKPGLGRHLWKTLDCNIKVIGVAKKHFSGSDAILVFRGNSRQPLFVTAAGIDRTIAAGLISSMQGKYRLPTLLKKADSLSREG
jgi:deoxyribonuclease V